MFKIMFLFRGEGRFIYRSCVRSCFQFSDFMKEVDEKKLLRDIKECLENKKFKELEDFEIAGTDKVFYPAQATIVNGKEVLVKSSSVPQPVAVRYAWSNWVVGTLFDTNLLPASSFRTDDWTDATQVKNKID